MKSKYLLIIFTCSLTALFSCENNLREVQKISLSEFSPSGDADDFVLKYTDSGKIKAILVSPKMLDFATVQFPFTEFPKGIFLTLYDNKDKKSFIKADFATSFKGSDLIDLRGNVKISNELGQNLTTEQLYFDQKNEWFYTEKPFVMIDEKAGTTAGIGIDFSKDFKIINYQNVTGSINQK
jgi:LPS export ABC transporter protein LptC